MFVYDGIDPAKTDMIYHIYTCTSVSYFQMYPHVPLCVYVSINASYSLFCYYYESHTFHMYTLWGGVIGYSTPLPLYSLCILYCPIPNELPKLDPQSGKYWHNREIIWESLKNVCSQMNGSQLFLWPSCRKPTFSHLLCLSFHFIKVSRIFKNGQNKCPKWDFQK